MLCKEKESLPQVCCRDIYVGTLTSKTRSVFSCNTTLSSKSGPLASQLTELTAATVTEVVHLALCT